MSHSARILKVGSTKPSMCIRCNGSWKAGFDQCVCVVPQVQDTASAAYDKTMEAAGMAGDKANEAKDAAGSKASDNFCRRLSSTVIPYTVLLLLDNCWTTNVVLRALHGQCLLCLGGYYMERRHMSSACIVSR